MANANLERGLAHVFGHEGGLSLDPNDRGNWTSGVIGKGELKGTKFGIASVFFLLFVFVFVIGPPPDDGRCSLPWC